MTVTGLIEGLTQVLREGVKIYELQAQYQGSKKVRVYTQHLPVADFEQDSYYPLVLVQFLTLEDAVNEALASILITIGTYDGENGEGWRDHLNLTETVRQYILMNMIVGKKYILKLPIYTAQVEKESDNFTFSNIFAQYEVPSVSMSYGMEAKSNGEFSRSIRK